MEAFGTTASSPLPLVTVGSLLIIECFWRISAVTRMMEDGWMDGLMNK